MSSTKKNAIGAAKVASFVVFFPLGVGLLINTVRKWIHAQQLNGYVGSSATQNKLLPINELHADEVKRLADQILGKDSESEEKSEDGKVTSSRSETSSDRLETSDNQGTTSSSGEEF